MVADLLRIAILAIATVTATATAAAATAEEFFSTRDENPLVRGFYLPLATDSRAGDGATVGATFSIMNTVNAENRGDEKLLVDGESDTLRLTYDAAPLADWRYRITVPVIHDSGGFLDGPIDDWHRFFGFSQGERPYYPKGQLVYFYQGKGRLLMQGAQSSLGDVSADLGWYLDDTAQRTVSLWAGLKAPTGSKAGLTSDGAWDAAAWGHVAWRWTRWHAALELGLTQPFGDQLFAGAAHITGEFARFAVTRDLGSRWALRAQLDGQTRRVEGTELRLLGPSGQLSVGATRRLANGWRLQLGFAEDAAVNTAPDITFFLGIHH